MDDQSMKSASFFDKVRQEGGNDNLKRTFRGIAQSDREKAISLINDEDLSFSSLFALKDDIRDLSLSRSLNPRNKKALDITNVILSRKSRNKKPGLWSEDKQTNAEALEWMLETGFRDEGTTRQYDEVLELSAVLLVKLYNNKTMLHIILEMIFSRYRKGVFCYDLVWAFFGSRDPQSLIAIANKLCSNHPRDVELARKLLGFIPCISAGSGSYPTMQYQCCIRWLEENLRFLYYTDESFQETGHPIPYAVALDARYLCKPVSPENGNIILTLTHDEMMLINQFRKLDSNTKNLLSDYSYMLYRQSQYWWNIWIHYPLSEQFRYAGITGGGLI